MRSRAARAPPPPSPPEGARGRVPAQHDVPRGVGAELFWRQRAAPAHHAARHEVPHPHHHAQLLQPRRARCERVHKGHAPGQRRRSRADRRRTGGGGGGWVSCSGRQVSLFGGRVGWLRAAWPSVGVCGRRALLQVRASATWPATWRCTRARAPSRALPPLTASRSSTSRCAWAGSGCAAAAAPFLDWPGGNSNKSTRPAVVPGSFVGIVWSTREEAFCAVRRVAALMVPARRARAWWACPVSPAPSLARCATPASTSS